MSGGGERNSREGLELGLSLGLMKRRGLLSRFAEGSFFNVVDECGSSSGSADSGGGSSGSLRKLQFLVGVKMFSRPSVKSKGNQDEILSGDKEESVANIAKTIGINGEEVKSSFTPQQKSRVISSLQDAGYQVAMIGDGLNDAPSLALAVGIDLQTAAQETAASDAASIIILGNKLSKVHTVS